MLPVDSVYGAWPASGEIDVGILLLSVTHTSITPLSVDSGDTTRSLSLLLHLFIRSDNPFPPCI